MLNMKNKKILFELLVMLMVIFAPLSIKADTLPSSITNIYELRDSGSLDGFPNNRWRAVGGNASQYGYYLSEGDPKTQYLPYKVVATGGNLDGSGSTGVVKNGGDYAVYCTLFVKPSPAQNSFRVLNDHVPAPTTCTLDNSGWDEPTRAGVASIIKSANGTRFAGTKLGTYYNTEVAINQFLYEKTGNECNHDSIQCGSGISENKITSFDNNLVANANAIYNDIQKKTGSSFKVTEPSDKKLTYSNSEDIWKSVRFDVGNFKTFKYTAVVKDSGGNTYQGYAYLVDTDNDKTNDRMSAQVGVCNDSNELCPNFDEPLAPGNYTVEVTLKSSYSYDVASNYNCGTGFQTVTPAMTDTVNKNEEKTVTFNFNVPEPSPTSGKLTIKKIDSETEKDLLGATITVIGKDIDFKKTYILDKEASKTITLEYGTYEIKEYKSPEGYQKDDKTYNVTIGENNKEEIVVIKNQLVKSSVHIRKIDDKTNKIVSGAKLKIFNEKDEVQYEFVTNEDETVYNGLANGKYYVVEVEAPKGYSLSKEKVEFEITDTKRDVTVNFKNSELVKVPDTLSNSSKIFIICGLVGIIAGISLVYTNVKKKEQV